MSSGIPCSALAVVTAEVATPSPETAVVGVAEERARDGRRMHPNALADFRRSPDHRPNRREGLVT